MLCKLVSVILVFSALFDSPHMLIAEEEKIIIEEMKGDQTIVEEKWVTEHRLLGLLFWKIEDWRNIVKNFISDFGDKGKDFPMRFFLFDPFFPQK